MNRARFAVAATLVGAGVAGAVAGPVLARRRPSSRRSGRQEVHPPIKGQADVEFIHAVTQTERRHRHHDRSR